MNIVVQGSETRVRCTKSEVKKLRDAFAVYREFVRITGAGADLTFQQFVERVGDDGRYQEPAGA